MENLLSLKEKGSELLHKGDLEGAVEAFTEAIGDLEVKNDTEALIKSICLLNRSNIRLMQKNFGDAFEDAAFAVYLFKIRRPNFEISQITAEPDQMVSMYAIAEQRKAEIYEQIDDIPNAIESYTLYGALTQSDPVPEMSGVFAKLGFPNIDRADKDLEIFTRIYSSLSSEAKILTTLGEIISFFQDNEPSEEQIKKIRDSGCALFMFGLMHLFIEKKFVILACLCIARHLSDFNIGEVYEGIVVVRSVVDHYLEDKDVMGLILKYLKNVPENVLGSIEIEDFLVPIMKALHLQITPEESDAGFWLLFRLIKTKDDFDEARKNLVIDEIFKKATKSSFGISNVLTISFSLDVYFFLIAWNLDVTAERTERWILLTMDLRSDCVHPTSF